MTRLDTQSAERLTKLLGMLGSNSDGERANAARMADQLVRGLGLTWGDIVIPAHAVPARDWRRMANYCLALRDQLNQREMEFVESVDHWLSRCAVRQTATLAIQNLCAVNQLKGAGRDIRKFRPGAGRRHYPDRRLT
jgi:hypothetical protein